MILISEQSTGIGVLAKVNNHDDDQTYPSKYLILLVDLAVFALPLTALFLIYILVVNPTWFRDFLNRLDEPGGTDQNR
jgi:hypothetical protein